MFIFIDLIDIEEKKPSHELSGKKKSKLIQ